ncbi:Gfo/Idh/MocA family oxidoreductase [Pelagibacteraceae bacterium]|nr:Gfo/Idh/MocA family oxidoreductase [Pelagibacteraceae bacterium]
MIKKKIALIGIGHWGKVHLKYLKKNKSILLEKIFYQSKKPKQISKKLLSDDINEIKNEKDIDFIDIVTPISTHSSILIYFIKTKNNILVEKPLLMNRKEENIIQKFINKKKRIIVSYPYQYSQSLKFAKKNIQNKTFGRLLYIEITIQQCGRFLEYNVNQLLGPHALSIVDIFLNINKLDISIDNIIKTKNISESSVFTCKKNQSILAKINLSLNYANIQNEKIIKFFLDKGTIIVDLNNPKHTYKSYKYIRKNNLGKIKENKKKYFNEYDNMKFVIEEFVNNKKLNIKKNFNLTKIINKIIK